MQHNAVDRSQFADLIGGPAGDRQTAVGSLANGGALGSQRRRKGHGLR